MKKITISVVSFFILFMLTNFIMAAGPQADITTIYLDIPACKTISVEVTDLQLRIFKVDRQNVYKPFFYSAKETPREVELRVSGKFGVIDLQTNNRYQWIAMVVNGEIFPLPELPKIPVCNDECILGERQCTSDGSCRVCGNYNPDPCTEWSIPFSCSTGQVCIDGRCLTLPSSSPPQLKVDEWRQMVTDYQEGDKWFSVVIDPKQWDIKDVKVNNHDAGNVFGKEASGWSVSYNGTWENGNFLCKGFIVNLPDTPSYISFSFKPKTNGFLNIYFTYGGKEEREGDWTYEGMSDTMPGAPAKNPPEGKGTCPTTWGSIKKG